MDKTLVNKSKWTPPEKSVDPELLNCIKAFTEEVNELHLLPEKRNLSPSELTALRHLRNNRNIVFKKADKGSATVIMDKVHYLAEGYRQLNNSVHYKKLNAPVYPVTALKVSEILRRLCRSGFITEKQLAYLLPPSNPRPRHFYMLPKLHKSADCWTIPNKMPPGRPIVSDCGSESKRVAGFIDSVLKPFAIRHPAYIKNTYDFVDKIKNVCIPEDCILITLDVESMYTNIGHAKGLRAVREAFRCSNTLIDAVMELLEIP